MRLAIPLFFALAALPPATLAGYESDLGLAVHYDDNLSRAERSGDRIPDTAFEFSAHLSAPALETSRSTLLWDVGLTAQIWTQHAALSEFAPSAGLRYRYRMGPDFSAPWVEAGFSARALQHADSVMRDGGEVLGGLTLGQRLTEQLDARLGYRWRVRRAEKEAVFDLENHEGFVQLDFQLDERWLVYGGFTARSGDLVTVSKVPNRKALSSASAISRGFDFAFGDTPRRAYRIDGLTLSPALGLNYLLAERWSLDLVGDGLVALADGDNTYHQFSLTFSLLWQF